MPSAGVANDGETYRGGLTRSHDRGPGLRRLRGAQPDRDLVAAGTQHPLCDAVVVGSQVEALTVARHRDVRAGPRSAAERAFGGQHAVDANVYHQLPACWACRPGGGAGEHHRQQRSQNGQLQVARRHVHGRLDSLSSEIRAGRQAYAVGCPSRTGPGSRGEIRPRGLRCHGGLRRRRPLAGGLLPVACA